MHRGTTPTVEFTINDEGTALDLDTIVQIWVTFRSTTSSTLITKDIDEVTFNKEKSTVSVTLSQKDTLAFQAGTIKAQIRFLTSDGNAFASPIYDIPMSRILKDGEIHE